MLICISHQKNRKQIYYYLAGGKNLIKVEKNLFCKLDSEGHIL